MMRLTTIALVVSDAKKSAKWYTEKLGFEIREHQGHWITVAPKTENIAFHLCEGFYPLEPGNSGISFTAKDEEGRSRPPEARRRVHHPDDEGGLGHLRDVQGPGRERVLPDRGVAAVS